MAKELCIAIPTYNRKKFLIRLLEQLKTELVGIENRVSVCVVDNASSDGTYEQVCEFESNYELNCYRNEKNIGYDANVAKSISKANADYVWLMGDDDLFVEGRIKEVVSFLNEKGQGFGGVFANYYRYKKKIGLPLRETGVKTYIRGEYDEDFYTAVYGSNFIGCPILNTEICREIIEKNLEYVPEGVIKKNLDKQTVVLREFMQQYLSFECVERSEKFAIFTKPCTQYVGDGSYSTIDRMLTSGKLTAERLLEFEKFYPDIFRYCACPFLQNNIQGLMQTAVLYDPNMNKKQKNIYYESVEAMNTYYKKHGDVWGHIYSLFFWVHKNLPFFDKIIWHTYKTFLHLRGRKTYREREDDKKINAKVRKTEF